MVHEVHGSAPTLRGAWDASSAAGEHTQANLWEESIL
jgi:hypothetical protein